ncbi:MAG: Ribonuclease R winged-helix domain protein [Methanosaeta sp. PtaU1.Bin112]|nr:MAG: Ribonuclease R winged-helix domain protein [Methanosaeta sp. PtaU1.Bin112]
MKLLTKAHVSQRRLIEILRVIENSSAPIGARAISDCLCSRGYDLGERAVRYNLKILDELGFTKKKGYSGRVLTPLGLRELDDALVDDRIGFVNTRIEEYMFKTSFDPKSCRGDVIANTSIIDKSNAEEVFEILQNAFVAGYTISRRVLILEEEECISNLEIPRGAIGIATLCSITLDGMLMKRGIPVLTSFAGLAEVMEKQTARFTDLIAYAGSSLDPIKVFMGRKVTRVADAIFKGSGTVLANVREVPVAAAAPVRALLDETQNAGLGGLIRIGEPSEPILGCPVGSGKIGIAFYAGVNGVVAAEEMGIEIKTAPISILIDYAKTHELR